MNTRGLRILVFLFCIIWLGSFSGCETISSGPSSASSTKELANLEVSPSLKFPDVPTPSGFQFIPKESYTFQSGGFRVGLLRYIGKGLMDQVVNFYRDQMPVYNWNLINVIQHESSVLNLEKEGETCVITIYPKGANTQDVLVSIAPKPTTTGISKRNKKSTEEVVK